jgi:hypothetical protein
MATTQRASWPSADLWKRVQNNTLAEDSPCPACELPAVVHFRDQSIGALFCPEANSPEEKAKLWAMVRSTEKYKGIIASTRAGGPSPVTLASLQDATRAEVDRTRERNPDYDMLRPWVIQILARSPEIALQDAVDQARQLRKDAEELQRRQVLEESARRPLAGRPAVRPDYYRRYEGNVPAAAPKKPKKDTGGISLTVKRRYDLED